LKTAIDITGNRYGKLTVIQRGNGSPGKVYWVCVCDCGNTIVVSGNNLKTGNTKSCGCLKTEPQAKNIAGKRFGRLTAVRRVKRERDVAHWLCQCDCGNTSVVSYAHLSTGHTQSCGCYSRESSSVRAKQLVKYGADHPRWRTDLTEEDRDRRRDRRHKEWSRAVLERDGYRCAICSTRGILHAHHLYSYKTYPELRYELLNGVSLCDTCHRRFHKAMGYNGSKEADLFTFFNLPNPNDGIVDWASIPAPTQPLRILALTCIAHSNHGNNEVEDLQKAIWYLEDEIRRIESEEGNQGHYQAEA